MKILHKLLGTLKTNWLLNLRPPNVIGKRQGSSEGGGPAVKAGGGNGGQWRLIQREVCATDECTVDPCRPQPTVVIVGAGVAGITAADRLIQCGINNFVILEATDRPGGRIHSCWMRETVAELGAEWILGGNLSNPIFTMACVEGLLKPPLPKNKETKYPLYLTSDGRAIETVVGRATKRIYNNLKGRAAGLFGLAEDPSREDDRRQTLMNYMEQSMEKELICVREESRDDMATVLHGLLNSLRCRWGVDLTELSAKQYGSFIEVSGDSVSVPSGFVGVLGPALKNIPSKNIQYCKPVRKIEWGEGCHRAVVRCCDGDEFPADFVVVTVSLGVLKSQMDMFQPPLPDDKRESIRKLGYGHIDKIFLEYEEPFWAVGEGKVLLAWNGDELKDRKDWVKGISMMEEVAGGCRNLLKVTVGGREAVESERLPEQELALDLTRLVRQFTGDRTLPMPVGLLRSKWSGNAYFQGANSYLSLESDVEDQCELGTPVPGPRHPSAPVILFAGEATCPGHFSTVHGARLSGIREADRILKLTKRWGGPPPPLYPHCATCHPPPPDDAHCRLP